MFKLNKIKAMLLVTVIPMFIGGVANAVDDVNQFGTNQACPPLSYREEYVDTYAIECKYMNSMIYVWLKARRNKAILADHPKLDADLDHLFHLTKMDNANESMSFEETKAYWRGFTKHEMLFIKKTIDALNALIP